MYGYEARYSFHLWDAIAFFDSLDSFIKDKPSLSDLRFRDNIQSIVMSFVTGDTSSAGSETTDKKERRIREPKTHLQQQRERVEPTEEIKVDNEKKGIGTTSEGNEIQDKKTFLWKEAASEVALIGSFNVSLVSSFKESQCTFWHTHGLLDYVWVS